MNLRNWQKAIQGQSLFELLVTVAVASLIIVGLVPLASIAIRNATFAGDKNTGNQYIKEIEEWLRVERDSGWSTLLTNIYTCNTAPHKRCFADKSWSGNCIPTGECPGTGLKRDVSFTCSKKRSPTAEYTSCNPTNDIDTIEATTNVSWTDAKGKHLSSSSIVLTSWQTIIKQAPTPTPIVTILTNSPWVSSRSCNTMCAGLSKICINVGTDSDANDLSYTDNNPVSCSTHTFASSVVGCSTVMTYNGTFCGGYANPWTRCRCQ